jgi:hypothetical protein
VPAGLDRRRNRAFSDSAALVTGMKMSAPPVPPLPSLSAGWVAGLRYDRPGQGRRERSAVDRPVLLDGLRASVFELSNVSYANGMPGSQVGAN